MSFIWGCQVTHRSENNWQKLVLLSPTHVWDPGSTLGPVSFGGSTLAL